MTEIQIEKHDKFLHKKRGDICVVNFTSVDGDVNYRIKFQRHSRYSTRKNFLKNWKPLNEPVESFCKGCGVLLTEADTQEARACTQCGKGIELPFERKK